MFYWFLKWIAIGPLLRVVFRPQVSGSENVPDEGPAILASNHLSYADWLFMPLTLTRRVTFVAKAEYFNTPGIKGWFQKRFFSGAGQVPIDRSGASAAEGALTAAKRVLDEGELFGIYPEGTRSHDGRLYRGKTGVARLALETGVPVIPVAVVGTDVVAPPGKKFGSFTRPDRALRQAAGLLAATRAWRTTATSCGRSPTRSCTRSCGSPARSTSTCTPPWPRRSRRRPTRRRPLGRRAGRGARPAPTRRHPDP